MSYNVLQFEVLKGYTERLRLLAIQEEWYAIFEGELEGKLFEEYHGYTQESAFFHAVDYWTNMMEENIWSEIVKDWGEDYVINVWLKDNRSTDDLKIHIKELEKQYNRVLSV